MLEGLDQGANWLNFTNFFVEKSDFLKIRNIGIAYDYKPKKYLKSVNLAFNVYNPFAFTASSVDPEAALAGARSQGAVAVGGLNYSSSLLPSSCAPLAVGPMMAICWVEASPVKLS